jgi:hypothetical protein
LGTRLDPSLIVCFQEGWLSATLAFDSSVVGIPMRNPGNDVYSFTCLPLLIKDRSDIPNSGLSVLKFSDWYTQDALGLGCSFVSL